MSTASDDSIPDSTTPDTGATPDATASDSQPGARQEHEIEVIRDHLGNLLGELGVRRDEWRPSHILRRLPIPFLLLGLGGVCLGAGVGIWQSEAIIAARSKRSCATMARTRRASTDAGPRSTTKTTNSTGSAANYLDRKP